MVREVVFVFFVGDNLNSSAQCHTEGMNKEI